MSIDFTMPGADGFEGSGPPSLELSLSRILQRLLRTGYEYAMMTPEKIYLYLQVQNGRAGADLLFEIDGNLYEVHTIGESSSTVKYDTGAERQQQLMGFLAQGLGELVELFISYERPIPSQIWSSIEVNTEKRATIIGYASANADKFPTTDQAIQEWKSRLQLPNGDLNGELEFASPLLHL